MLQNKLDFSLRVVCSLFRKSYSQTTDYMFQDFHGCIVVFFSPFFSPSFLFLRASDERSYQKLEKALFVVCSEENLKSAGKQETLLCIYIIELFLQYSFHRVSSEK